jgi:hypothetical protein
VFLAWPGIVAGGLIIALIDKTAPNIVLFDGSARCARIVAIAPGGRDPPVPFASKAPFMSNGLSLLMPITDY